LQDTEICSIWLDFHGEARPFLEIMEYSSAKTEGARAVNSPGYGHIAVQVPDIEDVIDRILQFGGRTQGEVVNLGSSERPCLCVYVRDPEGNLLELESRPQD
jgi:catechol 2,3-dioxygenase-like lactoylglutathione lyase family enzyme